MAFDILFGHAVRFLGDVRAGVSDRI